VSTTTKVLGIGCLGMLALTGVSVGLGRWAMSSANAERIAQAEKEAAAVAAKQKAAADAFNAMTPDAHLQAALAMIEKPDLASAEKHLKATSPETTGVAAARARLAQAKTKAAALHAAEQKKGLAEAKKMGEGLRVEYAKRVERHFLEKGMSVDVTAEGPGKDVLRIKWALASKAAAYQMGQGELIGEAQAMGFRKVIFTNGFSSGMGFTWSWDLSK